jgi:hypothetical protein
MREGGLGLPLFAIIGTLAYQASAGIIDATQHAATTAFYESLRAKLDTQIVNHLKSWEHLVAKVRRVRRRSLPSHIRIRRFSSTTAWVAVPI